jgi:hypothetical protein
MGNWFGKKSSPSPSPSSSSSKSNGEAKGKAPVTKAQEHPPAATHTTTPTPSHDKAEIKGHQPEDEVLSQDDLRAQELRNKADQHAKQRGEYYEQSQQAFKSGDKAAAKVCFFSFSFSLKVECFTFVILNVFFLLYLRRVFFFFLYATRISKFLNGTII